MTDTNLNAILVLVVLAAFTSLAIADETMEGVSPGAISADLGDGYQMSFVLDDSIESYDIEIEDPSEGPTGDRYTLVVYEAGTSDILIAMWVHVWPWEIPYPMYTAKTESEYGMTSQDIPRTIDGALGAVYYMWEDDKATGNPEDAGQAEFVYLPGGVVSSDGEEITTTIEVRGQMSFWDSGIGDALPVFESVVDSIHVSGPGT